MGYSSYFAPGDYNLICSVCGKQIKASEAKMHWQGMLRCESCWEPRHPQDFVQALPGDELRVPQVQKDGDIDIIAPAFPKSNVAVTNTYAFDITAFWYTDGANVTQILVNGSPISRTATSATIPAGQTIQFTYTGLTPMWDWQGAWQTTIGVEGI